MQRLAFAVTGTKKIPCFAVVALGTKLTPYHLLKSTDFLA